MSSILTDKASESMTKKLRDRIDLRVDPEFRDRMEAAAKRYDLDLTSWIKVACTEKLQRDQPCDKTPVKEKP